MSTAVTPAASPDVDFINPVISATKNVFKMMLESNVARTGLALKQDIAPAYDVSAVIGMAGLAQGTIVLSFTKEVACAVLNQLVGIQADSINDEVCDAIGELANMVAGSAKAQLAELDLGLSIPNVVTGKGHQVHYPSNVVPVCISFNCDFGPFTIEIGFAKSAT